MSKYFLLMALCVSVFVGCGDKVENPSDENISSFDFSALKSEAEAQNIDLSNIMIKQFADFTSDSKESAKVSNVNFTPQIIKSFAKFYLLEGEIYGENAMLYLEISSASNLANASENSNLAYIVGKIVRSGEIFTLKGEVDLMGNAKDTKTIQLEIANENGSMSKNKTTQIFEAHITQNGEVSGRFIGDGIFKDGTNAVFTRAQNKVNEIAIFGVNVAQKHIGKDYDGKNRDFDFNVSLQIPLIVAKNNKINFALDKINATLRNMVKTDFSEYMDDSSNFSSISAFEVVYIDERVIVFNSYDYIYNGGAHGNYSNEAVAFLLENGEQIANEPNTLLKNENDPVLKSLIKKRLVEEYGDSVDENATFSRFKITPNGVEFYWGVYEIASYAVGIVTIHFDFSELKSFVREDSPYYYLFAK